MCINSSERRVQQININILINSTRKRYSGLLSSTQVDSSISQLLKTISYLPPLLSFASSISFLFSHLIPFTYFSEVTAGKYSHVSLELAHVYGVVVPRGVELAIEQNILSAKRKKRKNKHQLVCARRAWRMEGEGVKETRGRRRVRDITLVMYA